MKNQSGVGGHLGAERGLAAAADLGEGVRGHCAGGCLLLHAHTARGRAAAGTGKHALQAGGVFSSNRRFSSGLEKKLPEHAVLIDD